MGVYKVTVLLNSKDISPAVGWSESWEYSAPGDVEAKGILDVIKKDRPLFLSQDYAIVGFRIQKVDAFNPGAGCKKVLGAMVPLSCTPPIDGKLGPADTPWAAVYVRIGYKPADEVTVGKPRFRTYEVRGIPDTWWEGAVLSIPGPDKSNVITYLVDLQNAYLIGNARLKPACAGVALLRYDADNACIQRISNRKIGRPFFLVRGRRSAATT